jgi:hypothetical protein
MARAYYRFEERFSQLEAGLPLFLSCVCKDRLDWSDPNRLYEDLEAVEADLAASSLSFLEALTTIGGLDREAPRLPGRKRSDQPALVASVLLKLRKDYGRDEWVRRFLQSLADCPRVEGAGEQAAREQALNWVVAASCAAQEDLSDLFRQRWRLPVDLAARQALLGVDWRQPGLSPPAVFRTILANRLVKEEAVPAPDFSSVKPLAAEDFRTPSPHLPNHAFDTSIGGYRDGVYFMRDTAKNRTWSYGKMEYRDFACELVGRLQEPTNLSWGLGMAIVKENEGEKSEFQGLQILLTRDARIEVKPFPWDPNQGGTWPAAIRHPAIKPGTELNALMAVVRGRQLEICVNGVAVAEPIPIDRDFVPARLFLQGWKGEKELHVEFHRLRVWPAEGAPTFAERRQKAKDRQATVVKVKCEGEALVVRGCSPGCGTSVQEMQGFRDDKWSGDRHRIGGCQGPGEWCDLELPKVVAGSYRVSACLTKARDYGILQLRLNGAPLGKPIDGFCPNKVVTTGLIDLGTVELKTGAPVLRIEITGTNPGSVGKRYLWGVDYVLLERLPGE